METFQGWPSPANCLPCVFQPNQSALQGLRLQRGDRPTLLRTFWLQNAKSARHLKGLASYQRHRASELPDACWCSPHHASSFIRSTSALGAEQLKRAFDPALFLPFVGGRFDLTISNAASLETLGHLVPLVPPVASSSGALLISSCDAFKPMPRSAILRFSSPLKTNTSVLLLGANAVEVVMVGRFPSLTLPDLRRWNLKHPGPSRIKPGPQVR